MQKAFLFVIACASIFFMATSFRMQQEEPQYCNARFSFCIHYPTSFTGQGESDNHDGQTFLSKNEDLKILAFGSLATDPYENLEEYYKLQSSNYEITDLKKSDKDYLFSGKDKEGNFIRCKIVKARIAYDSDKEDTDVFQVLEIVGKDTLQGDYKTYVNYINKWNGSSNFTKKVIK